MPTKDNMANLEFGLDTGRWQARWKSPKPLYDSGALLQCDYRAVHPAIIQLEEPDGRYDLKSAFACCAGIEE